MFARLKVKTNYPEGGDAAMVLVRQANFNWVSAGLARINQEAQQASGLNLNDLVVHLENLYCRLLNEVFGWNLVNANTAVKNHPGIDLIDEGHRICVQVTADNSAKKIAHTLSRSAVERLADKGYRLKMCYVGRQTAPRRASAQENPFNMSFDASRDLIFTKDILCAFNGLDVDRQERVMALLKRELGTGCALDLPWFEEKFESTCQILGPRYTPELNFDTRDGALLQALGSGSEFWRQLREHAHRVAASAGRLEQALAGADGGIAADVLEGLAVLRDCTTGLADGASCETSEQAALDFVGGLIAWLDGPGADFGLGLTASAHKREYADLWRVASAARSFCASTGVPLLSTRSVLLKGEAGIGKSHLLADFCHDQIRMGRPAVMVLGGQFYGELASADAIPRMLGLTGTLEDLLDELECVAEIRDGAAFLVVDALNEGAGRTFWKDALPVLAERVQKRERVRLLISARADALGQVVPDWLIERDRIGVIECRGFQGRAWEALDYLCQQSGVQVPVGTCLGIESDNPLHLQLLCRYFASCRPSRAPGVTMNLLVDFFLRDINERLANSAECSYDRNVDLVSRCVKALAEAPTFSYGMIPYADAQRIVEETVRGYVALPGNFLGLLVKEGLFTPIESWDGRQLSFCYELIENYACACAAIDAAKARQAAGEFGAPLDALNAVLHDEGRRLVGKPGAMAALGALAPEACDCEIYELDWRGSSLEDVVHEAFVEGLPWRLIKSVTPAMERYIHKAILPDSWAAPEFLCSAYSMALRPSGFNADYYADLVLALPAPERDVAWSAVIAGSSASQSFVDWAWARGDTLDSQEARGAAVTLTLTLAATAPRLRRKAVKALAFVLVDRPGLAHELWERFAGADDDYILEGLCGAVYGAAVNSNDLEGWRSVADEMQSFVFGAEAYPHVAVRDYALALHDAVYPTLMDLRSLEEPYGPAFRSRWYADLPSNDEIDALVMAKEAEFSSPDCHRALDWMVHSMTTEYGRGMCAYGDFGRYIFGLAVALWAPLFGKDQLLSNAVLKEILEGPYQPDFHATNDVEVRAREDRWPRGCERIGKKYQKIGLMRLMGRLTDSFVPPASGWRRSSGQGEPAALAGPVRALGCEAERPDPASEEPLEAASLMEVTEEILSLREDDPSFLWMWSSLKSPYVLADVYRLDLTAAGSSADWCASADEGTAVGGFRTRRIGSRTFYTLAGCVDWKESRYGKRWREATWLSDALVVPLDEAEAVCEGHLTYPRSLEMRHVRFGEYLNGMGCRVALSAYEAERDEVEQHAHHAAYEYVWLRDREELEDERVQVWIPAEDLVRYFGLKRSGPLEWKGRDGRTFAVCLVDQTSESTTLLFDAEALDEYLAASGQTLVWADYFEKQTGSHLSRVWTQVRREKGRITSRVDDEWCGEKDRGIWAWDSDWVDAVE